MSFTSLVFCIFLPVVLLAFWLTPQRYRWLPLLLASYVFYAYYNLWLLLLIFTTTGVSYLCALGIQKHEKHKKLLTVLAALVCLGLLFVFKYLDFVVGGVFSLMQLFGAEVHFQGFHLILPMGISFYVFQTMSYTFDAYRGKITAERHLGYYALFVVFFPQLVAGPIERPEHLIPQLKHGNRLNKEDVMDGIYFLIRGYAKKLIIADMLAPVVNSAYGNLGNVGGFALLIATFFFALQIYCDFSGYSDIAVGCARLMGIRLSKNFDRPYSASSIGEFWKRWHISLTSWFTDYLYIPLGGNRRGFVRGCVNVLIVFLISGLWHGANWTFVVWGGLHGCMLVGERIFHKFYGKKIEKGKPLFQCLTFLFVCFAWIFFRAQTLNDAGIVIAKIFSDWQFGATLNHLQLSLAQLITLLAVVCTLPLLERLPKLEWSDTVTKKQCAVALLYLLLVIAIVLCHSYILAEHGESSFIYFSF